MDPRAQIAKDILTGLARLEDEQTEVLVASGKATDTGTIETQRGVVLGIRLAQSRIRSICKDM